MTTFRYGRSDSCPCGSGRKFKRCCYGRQAAVSTLTLERPRLLSGDGSREPGASPKPAGTRQTYSDQPITRVPVFYTYPEPVGEAECVYSFPVDQLILLTNGSILPVQWLQPGMMFRMDGDGVGTVTAVEPPKVYEPPPPTPDENGNYRRRVLGTIKHKSVMVLDVTFGGQTVTTTPGHLFYSVSREEWVPVGSMRPGETLRSHDGAVMAIEAISPLRTSSQDMYNLEIEEFHTYYVGSREHGAVLVHNGQGDYIRKPLQVDALGNAIPHGF